MPMVWPVWQTAEGGYVFASVVPPNPQLAAAAMQACRMSPESQQGNKDFANNASEAKYPRRGLAAPANSRQPPAKLMPASEDALTAEEIEQLCMAVENTRRKLQDPESLASLRRDLPCFAGAKTSSKSEECDIETSSSTGIPSSRQESEGEDAHSTTAYYPTRVLDEYRISDEDVDTMSSELESKSSDRRKMAIQWVVRSTRPLALTRRGCRIVQRALDLATVADQEQIVANMEGFVLEALQSPHANYVLQKCIEVVPPQKLEFVLKELKGQGVFVARHRFGCRIIQRSIERCTAEQTEELIEELLLDAPQLVRHTYGNFVMQHVLQYGTSDQIHQIAEVLLTDAIRFAKHRIASHVVSCAVSCCSPDDIQSLTEVLLGEQGQVADLMNRQYGSYVLREVNRVNTRLCDAGKNTVVVHNGITLQ
jgi:hypothetical protein